MSYANEFETLLGSYRDVVTHKLMLQDVVRTSAYADAIRAVVKPGDRVIDFGTGTGVLAIFAARAGARRVLAIERTSMVEHAREIARRNGHFEIQFHHGDEQSFTTDSPVDVIVSEWMGHFLFFESMLEPLITLRKRWLKPGGIMIPARVSLTAALVIDEELYEDGAFLETSPYGIDFGSIANLPLRQSRFLDIEEHQILTPTIDLGSLDMLQVERTPTQLSGATVVEKAVTAFGLVGWFDAWLSQEVEFSTGPHQARTHWRPMFFPFPEPFECCPSRPINVTIVPPRNVEVGDPVWAWSISDSKATLAVDERDTFARTCGAPKLR